MKQRDISRHITQQSGRTRRVLFRLALLAILVTIGAYSHWRLWPWPHAYIDVTIAGSQGDRPATPVLDVSPDGDLLAIGFEQKIELWKVDDIIQHHADAHHSRRHAGSPVTEPLARFPFTGRLRHARFSPDGRQLVAARYDRQHRWRYHQGRIDLIELPSFRQKEIFRFSRNRTTIRPVGFSSDDRVVIVRSTQLLSDDGNWYGSLRNWLVGPPDQLYLHDIATGRRTGPLPGHAARFASSDRRLVTYQETSRRIEEGVELRDGVIRIYDYPLKRLPAMLFFVPAAIALIYWLLPWFQSRLRSSQQLPKG